MEELTMEEIIKYSVRVLQDSFLFYRRVSKRVGSDLKTLTDELADRKAKQLRDLKNLLSDCIINNEDLGRTEDVETSPFDRFFENGNIPVHATPRDILAISLRRERILRETYDLILSLPLINTRVSRVIGNLRMNSSEQMASIENRLNG
jgi:hypothetical protein